MDIEKEVKKITLGHEIGAGAACLKCKDKCEGFELHFWRKICRNCKCGLEDHDVQLQSEENQKVGRLFEDTKYTSLMAKLKRDGVPSYQGSQLTITISTPAIGAAVPVAVAGTAGTVSPVYSQGVPGYDAPSVPHKGAPTAAGHGAPAVHGQGAPAVHGQGAPAVHGQGAPSIHGQSAPSVHGQGAPSVHGQGAPSVHGQGAPSVHGQGAPSVHGQGASSIHGQGAPSVAHKGAPSATGQGFPSVPGGSIATGHGIPSAPSVAAAVTPAAVAAKKDVVKAVTYEWAPPGVKQKLALQYMELLPPERRPIAGTQGADYRKKQMAKQLPEHDQDPELCHELSPAEVKQMQQYVRKYKDEALGIGDLTLPEEFGSHAGIGVDPGAPRDQGTGAVGKVGIPGAVGAGSGAGPAGKYACHHCHMNMNHGDPAVYAERAGYDKLWHPGCFVCCTCNELLVDMIYFWKKGKLYCGRHYGDSEKPRCGGCDELIFSNEYTQAEGQNWHLKHFCCFDCDCVLAGETYVMENDKPVCQPCYMKNHAVATNNQTIFEK
ncbi:testin isoform X2 [Tachysurus fulvidraco]|uniref:testin isoform X2 n=1 Tax=Tachysurus fulvidraco TaxID=1234273 RepID=UPI001FED7D64|nr:testin isoform X2 [Tachysurus fulvidraco]